MKRVCKQCGKEFYIAQSEVSFYKSKNLQLPKRCKECREANKQQKPETWKKDEWGKDTAGRNADRTAQKHGIGSAGADASVQKPGKVSAGADAPVQKPGKVSAGADAPVQKPEKASAGADASVQKTGKGSAWPYITGQKPEAGTAQPGVTAQEPGTETAQPDISVPKQDAVRKKLGLKPKLLAAAAVLAVIAAGRLLSGTADGNGGAAVEATAEPYEASGLAFRSSEYLEEHYQKHGVGMGFASAQEYQAAAAAVVGNAEALHKTEAEDGDDVYYVESTNELVIVSADGYIRTYFRPDSGIDYYNGQ